MGILTDYFIATPEALAGLDLGRSPVGRVPGIQAKGADIVKLGTLQRLLADQGGRRAGALDPTACVVGTPTSEGPWVFRLPTPLVDALADVPAAAVPAVAARWAATEEWRSDRGTAEGLTRLLAELSALAKQARTTRQAVYLWISL